MLQSQIDGLETETNSLESQIDVLETETNSLEINNNLLEGEVVLLEKQVDFLKTLHNITSIYHEKIYDHLITYSSVPNRSLFRISIQEGNFSIN